MWQFSLFGFPIRVHWIFWLNSALLGGAFYARTPQQIQGVAVWMAMVFLSILIHELGHALVMRRFGDRRVEVVLYAFGGLAIGTAWRSRWEQIMISAAGPALQMAAGGVLWAVNPKLSPFKFFDNSITYSSFSLYAAAAFIFISLFWGALNLLPIIPMDGGRISEAFMGPSRERLADSISLVLACALAVYMLSIGAVFAALFFGMLGWNNWQRLNHRPQVPWMDVR